MVSSSGSALIALLLSWNYLAFQVELFDNEYEANHPKQPTSVSIVSPVLSWESFDKDQANSPYTFDAFARLEVVDLIPVVSFVQDLPHAHSLPVRDKSPPFLSD